MTLQQLRIFDVWKRLGGGELRHSRGRAFWRNGDGWNIHVSPEKNLWSDHRNGGAGGGILKLVEVVLNCDRATALRFLETHCGLDVRRPLSLEEKRRYARAAAESELLSVRIADFANGLKLCAEQTVRALDAAGVDPEALAPYHRRLFILRTAKTSEIAALWRDMPAKRESVERVGRHDREHAEALAHTVVDLLAMGAAVEVAA